jgi:hypothetical protein
VFLVAEGSVRFCTYSGCLAHFFKVLSSKGGLYSSTDLARVYRQIIVGLLAAVIGILLLEIITCC